MVKVWEWARSSHVRAVDNARAASTELSRRRVEREDVELFLAALEPRPVVTQRPAFHA